MREKENPTIMRQKRTKIVPAAKTLKGRSGKKVVIPKETPLRRSPRMRGQISKESTSSKKSTKESIVHIVPNNSPPHPETTNIPKNPNEECRVEVNKNQDDSPIGQLGTSSCKDEIVLVISIFSLLSQR